MAHVRNKSAWIGAGILALVLLLGFSGGLGPRTALAAAPANDNFASAISASPLPFSDTQNTAAATTEAGEPMPTCQSAFSHSVWYNFTPAASNTYQVDTLSSDFDTVVDVKTGASLGTLVSVACNDDTGSGIGTGLQSRLTFSATGGTAYRIQVSGFGTNSGNLHVHVALAGQKITVNSTADTNSLDPVLTLREAMLVANGMLAPALLSAGECAQIGGSFSTSCTVAGGLIGASAADTIVFDTGVFPTGAPATITLGSTLPAMSTGDDTVSGSGAGVIVDGVSTGFDCFAMTGANPNGNTVKGLQITRCNNGVNIAGANNAVGDAGTGAGIGERDVISKGVNGIQISGAGASGNFVRHNYIGTDVTGAAAGFGNSSTGVLVSGAPGELIGGTDPSARNVISENASANIETLGAGSTGNVIEGNYIGTNAGGTAGLAGNGYGVYISSGSGDRIGGDVGTTPGGPCTGPCNVISASSPNGIQFGGASGNLVGGNFIGTNAAGTAAIGNITGVSIFGGSGNLIGGGAGLENLISGNPFAGVELALGTASNTVEFNLIGTNAGGTGAIANGDGVNVESVAGNSIQSNTISGNAVNGVEIDGAPSTGNFVMGNSIGTNALQTASVPNAGDGVKIDAGASGNTIGYLLSNLISGNGGNGVEITGAGGAGNTVNGNLIGTDASGDPPIPNTGDGVKIDSSPNNIIGDTAGTTPGGPCTGSCNVISGNSASGVHITGAASTGNKVQGNFIGTDKTGAIGVGNTLDGVLIDASAATNTIGGTSAAARNVISKNSADGVQITGTSSTGNIVEGNYVGTNAAGTAAIGNLTNGVYISDSPGNTVGGTTSGSRNIMSGNGNWGVGVVGSGATGNLIEGNYIGTNAAGTAAIGNVTGVALWAPSNTVGGTTAGAANVISGNSAFAGMEIFNNSGAGHSNTIQGNLIGTNAAGTGAIPNFNGIDIEDSASNVVGGTLAGAGNVLSGNFADGVNITGSGSTGNQVYGNYIGTNATGSVLNNGGDGVELVSGASNNFIGGVAAGQGNTITNNSGDGVGVGTGTGNAIRANSIYGNTQQGIDLNNDGVTLNDPGDGDSGPNNLQNFPVVTQAFNTGANTFVEGALNSTANTAFAIDFFSSPACDPSGYGEGKVFLGSRNVTTVGHDAGFKVTDLPVTTVGQVITATATDPSGNTSEFSQCITVSSQPSAPLIVPAAMSGQQAPNGGTFDPGFDLGINGGGTAVFADTTSTSAGTYLFFAGSPTTLASAGDPAGASGTFQMFDSPVDNSNGQVAAQAMLSDNTTQGLFLFFAGSPPTGTGLGPTCTPGPNGSGYTNCSLALTGQQVPGNNNIYSGYSFRAFDPPVLNNNNNAFVVARATFTKGADTRQGLFLFFAGTAPPTGSPCRTVGGVNQCPLTDNLTDNTIQAVGTPVINDAGYVADVVKNTSNVQSLVLFAPSAPFGGCQLASGWTQEVECTLATQNGPSPDGSQFRSFGDISLSNLGTIAALASTDLAPFSISNGSQGGLFLIPVSGTGSRLKKLMDTFVLNNNTETITGLSNPAVNTNPMVVARATFTGADPATDGLFVFSPASVVKIVAQRDSAPVGLGFYCHFVHLALNDVAQLAFVATANATQGLCGDPSDFQGVWVATVPLVDTDGDLVQDFADNCPSWSNTMQNLPSWPVPAGDPDCDGFSTTVENSVGTNPLAHCGTNAWPADVNNDTSHFSDITDIAALAGYFGKSVPPAPVRYNIAPDPPDGFVDISDISRMASFFGKHC